MARVDGRKIVVVATGATVACLAVFQIYLPYFADRDKLRGMSEEEDMPAAARREMERQIRIDQATSQQQPPPQQQQAASSGSMWKNMKK